MRFDNYWRRLCRSDGVLTRFGVSFAAPTATGTSSRPSSSPGPPGSSPIASPPGQSSPAPVANPPSGIRVGRTGIPWWGWVLAARVVASLAAAVVVMARRRSGEARRRLAADLHRVELIRGHRESLAARERGLRADGCGMLPRHRTARQPSPAARSFVRAASVPAVETCGKGIHVRQVIWTMFGGSCLLMSACSGSGTTPTARASQSGSAFASPSTVATACASVHTTTPITKVPTACELLWEPTHDTLVPPVNILQQEQVPPAPPVKNMTNGAVSQADAQHWADAANWDSGWGKWAEANDQPFLLSRLTGPALVPTADVQALQQGATIEQPACNLYPTSYALFPVGAAGGAYFTRKRLPADMAFVFVVVFTGPCYPVAKYPDGHQQQLPGLATTMTGFEPGKLEHDPLVGDIWYADAGGNCDDPAGPPADWCGR